MNFKAYFFLIIIVISIILIVAQNTRVKKRIKNEYHLFYNNSIEGKLTDVSASVGIIYISVCKCKQSYSFIPITNNINNNRPFFNTAEIGDYIIKPSNSDTLRLFKNGKVYKYEFKKF